MLKIIVIFAVILEIFSVTLFCSQDEPATKSARIEAAFIIQNKAYALRELCNTLKQELAEAQVQEKLLAEGKAILEAMVKKREAYLRQLQRNNQPQAHAAEEAEKAAIELFAHNGTMKANILVQKIYPEFCKKVKLLMEYLLEKSIKLPEETLFYIPMRAEVDKAMHSKDIIYAQNEFMHGAIELLHQDIKLNQERLLREFYRKNKNKATAQDTKLQFKKIKDSEREFKTAYTGFTHKRKNLSAQEKKIRTLTQRLSKPELKDFDWEWFLIFVASTYREVTGKKLLP